MGNTSSVLSWLHLSDFHFQPLEDWDRRRSTRALLEYLAERKENGWRPDLVFATGDFADKGKREEFDQANFFFQKLAEKLELDLKEQLFVVPGNHDVDRGAIKLPHKSVIAGILGLEGNAQQESLAETLRDSDTLRFLGGRLSQYYDFTERLLGPARRTSEDRPWRVDVREIRGMKVAVMQLNSAWASMDKNDKGRLLVGAHQIDEALAEAGDARVRFALVHHPPDYLPDGDASRLRSTLQASGGAHFLVRGHLHENDLELSVDPSGSVVRLAAGAVYQGTNWPKRFQIGEIDLDRGQGRIELLTYSDRERGFWTVDATSYKKLPDGIYRYELPADLKPDRVRLQADPKRKEARQQAAFLRYRLAVAAVHGQMRFIGFPSSAVGTRPNVGVADLFVPVQMARRRIGVLRAPKDFSTVELLERLVPTGRKRIGRFVVLGEPGSGKTTLCRFIAAFVAGQESINITSVERTAELLPLFLPFRDYLRRRQTGADCGILEFLVEQAQRHLQVGSVDSSFFEEAIDAGKAVLLLDGLDEVGRPEERTETRDRVLAFCSQYPRLPVVVTSRFAGYQDAPLPTGEFQHLEVQPFDDDELRTFVGNWYTVQEPNDPQARERGRTDLLAALQTEPRVRQLAGNPLLATLIALVHRTEAKLPGERAKLYDLLVRTLLETWPEQAKRAFQEIDPDLQRSYLEEFALEQQKRRSSFNANVTFGREDLISGLALILGRREQSKYGLGPRRLAEKWADFLAGGTGIVVEQRPGIFSFLHLSLLEYLAAGALLRQEEPAEDAISRLADNPVWQEVLLLAVGSKATDPHLLDRVFSHLGKKEQWFLLLLCLREEAAFGNESRRAVLDRASRQLLRTKTQSWKSTQETIAVIERFSARHGRAVRAWRVEQLSNAIGESLVAAVAASADWTAACQLLEIRDDRSRAAADLLDLWPESQIRSWAIEKTSTDFLQERFAVGPAELAVFTGLTSLRDCNKIVIALAPHQLRAAANMTRQALVGIEKVRGLGRRAGKGLPLAIAAWPGQLDLMTEPRWPQVIDGSVKHGFLNLDRTRSLNFPWFMSLDLSEEPKHDFMQELVQNFKPRLVIDFVEEFTYNFIRDFAREYNRYFAKYFTQVLAEDLIRHFGRNLSFSVAPEADDDIEMGYDEDMDQGPAEDLDMATVQTFIRDCAIFPVVNQIQESTRIASPVLARNLWNPAIRIWEKDRQALFEYWEEPSEVDREAVFSTITTRRVAEAWIASASTARSSTGETTDYFCHRLQNLALLYSWVAVDANLPDEPEPEQLAFYLQLGWIQSTTTHEWPATERWIELMEAGPPTHWLPRGQWHLCWLLHDPSDVEHQLPFNSALREGLADTDPGRQAWAVAIQQTIGFYPENDSSAASGGDYL